MSFELKFSALVWSSSSCYSRRSHFPLTRSMKRPRTTVFLKISSILRETYIVSDLRQSVSPSSKGCWPTTSEIDVLSKKWSRANGSKNVNGDSSSKMFWIEQRTLSLVSWSMWWTWRRLSWIWARLRGSRKKRRSKSRRCLERRPKKHYKRSIWRTRSSSRTLRKPNNKWQGPPMGFSSHLMISNLLT